MRQRLPENLKIAPSSALAQDGVTEHWSTAAGCRMRYLVAGASSNQTPLLLIHGLLGYSFSWRFNLSALGDGRRVYAIDLPGVGYSERVSGLDCSARATAQRLLCFLREQGITDFDLLGTSHGGGVAMMLAALIRQQAQPLHVRKLILVAPVNPWSRHGLALTALLSTRPGAALFRSLQPFLRTTHGRLLARLYGDPHRITPGTVEGYSAPLAIQGTIEHALKIAGCLRNDVGEIKAVLPTISDIPTLLIWGDRDRAVLPKSAPLLNAQFNNAELVVINGAGHLPYEEFPEEFNRILIEFLNRN
jgi:pimeloyl-ACP methyl ester carboxylesterase